MALAGAQIPLEPKCVPAAETLRHNRGQRFSHEFRFCETEHLLGGAVELADQPSDDGIGGGVNNVAVFLLALL